MAREGKATAREAGRSGRKDGGGPRRWTLSLGAGGWAGVAATLALGLIWVFILGVLVGRGYRPEEAVPELAILFPKAPNATSPDEIEVLRPEDLEFYEDLEKRPAQAAPRRTASPVPAAPAASGATAPSATSPGSDFKGAAASPAAQAPAVPGASKPGSGGAPAAPGTPPPGQAASGGPQAVPGPSAVAGPVPDPAATAGAPESQAGGQAYRYAYQVAAFREVSQARVFQEKLKAEGLASRLETATAGGQTWQRVLVDFTGTPESTNELKTKLARVGVTQVIMREKVVVR